MVRRFVMTKRCEGDEEQHLCTPVFQDAEKHRIYMHVNVVQLFVI